MRSLKATLNAFVRPASHKARTVSVAVYPDGETWTLRKTSIGWEWARGCFSGGTGAYSAACHNVRLRGGKIERRPVR